MEDLNTKLDALFDSEDAYLFTPKEKRHAQTKNERLAEQFDGIVKFYRNNGRLPLMTSKDLSERLLAKRLNNYLTNKEKFEELQQYDELGILKMNEVPKSMDELFEKGDDIFGGDIDIFDVDKLPNGGRLRSSGSVATRSVCNNFDVKYKPLFEEKQRGLAEDKYKLIKFLHQEEVELGGFYVCDGMMCYVDEIGEQNLTFGRMKERIHVVYENGTESNVYLRTLSSELYKGYIVVEKNFERDNKSVSEKINGYVYVLSSESRDPQIEMIKDLYKIGKTDTTTEERIKNAEKEPTYLMAPVKIEEEIVCSGEIVPQRLEELLHKFFAPAQMDIAITGNNGNIYHPDEWYSVPLEVIDEAVDLIRSGEIVNYKYDVNKREIVEI